jgi:hypothetical protein
MSYLKILLLDCKSHKCNVTMEVGTWILNEKLIDGLGILKESIVM